MISTSLVVVVGVLLLSPFIQALDPVVIREEISTGIKTDQIVFKDEFGGDMSPLTRDDLCSSLVSLHEMHNEGFLGETITTNDCIDALVSETTLSELNEWSGSYCGTCKTPLSQFPSAHNFKYYDPSSSGPIYRSDCIHITPAGTSSGYIEAGSTVRNFF